MDAHVLEQAEVLAKSIATQATTMEELNGVMRTLMKSALEQMPGSELKVHLREEQQAADAATSVADEAPSRRGRNRRNGTSPKSIQGDMGKLALVS
jgi:hypothetical protein